MRKATDIGSIRNLLMRCVDVREEELITNYSTVILFKVMPGHRSSCCIIACLPVSTVVTFE